MVKLFGKIKKINFKSCFNYFYFPWTALILQNLKAHIPKDIILLHYIYKTCNKHISEVHPYMKLLNFDQINTYVYAVCIEWARCESRMLDENKDIYPAPVSIQYGFYYFRSK